jgi:hypothetical protein
MSLCKHCKDAFRHMGRQLLVCMLITSHCALHTLWRLPTWQADALYSSLTCRQSKQGPLILACTTVHRDAHHEVHLPQKCSARLLYTRGP